jgi:hypothetical protein
MTPSTFSCFTAVVRTLELRRFTETRAKHGDVILIRGALHTQRMAIGAISQHAFEFGDTVENRRFENRA